MRVEKLRLVLPTAVQIVASFCLYPLFSLHPLQCFHPLHPLQFSLLLCIFASFARFGLFEPAL